MAVSNYRILKSVLSNRSRFIQSYQNNQGYSPLDVELRLNWECNANCLMCGVLDYFTKEYKKKDNLTLKEIEDLLDQLTNMGCHSITLSGGEPTLRKDLVDIVIYASQKCKLNVSLNTNGYLLEDRILEKLIQAGINSFTLSLDSPEESIHDHIRGLKGAYRRIVHTIDYLNHYIKTCPTRKIFIFINCVVLKINIQSLHLFEDFYRAHRFDHLNFSPASIGTSWDIWTTEKEELRPSIEDVRQFKEMISKMFVANPEIKPDDPFGDTNEELDKNLHVSFSNRPSTCFIPMLHTVIQCNGDVLPCCYAPDEYTIGNIRQTPFPQLWAGSAYRDFRKNCKRVNYRMCVSCKQYEIINYRLNQILGGK